MRPLCKTHHFLDEAEPQPLVAVLGRSSEKFFNDPFLRQGGAARTVVL
jgi:hypothetical protein